MKIGRNDPCPCGSGRKYKHCFLRNLCDRSPWPPEAHAMTQAQMMAEQQRRQKFGEVRPIIHADHQGRRLVAVGSRVLYDQPEENKKWNTFTDVLMAYIRLPLGSGWGKRELLKPLADRHPVMQWYDHVCNLQKNTARLEANGLYSMQMDGVTSAFLHLAYDLDVLDERVSQDDTRPKAGVRDLLMDAATKETARPYVVFVDVNLPPDDPKGPPTWAEEVTQTARDVVAQIEHCPFDLIVFTNIPHHYGEVGGSDPATRTR